MRPAAAQLGTAAIAHDEKATPVARHPLRGEDPEAKRDVIKKENAVCKGGLRNLAHFVGEWVELRLTMKKVREAILQCREEDSELRNLGDAMGASNLDRTLRNPGRGTSGMPGGPATLTNEFTSEDS